MNLTEKDIARFWSKVNKDGPTMAHMEGPCWVWAGTRDAYGYGRFKVNGEHRLAHRFVLSVAGGDAPNNMCVCHHCDNPPCVNPTHLFIGTVADNSADKIRKGRANMPKGSAHGRAKLTDTNIRFVFAQRQAGVTMREIANHFGVSKSLIVSILQRKIWRHVNVE